MNLLFKLKKYFNTYNCRDRQTEKTNQYFNSLSPMDFIDNEIIYTEALNYAFKNDDIKNIAITGIYGAGKSSLWLSYINMCNKKERVIEISLGNYNDSIEAISAQSNSKVDINENRLERQIINQILAQLDSDCIVLSKYKFKKNISMFTAIFNTVMVICILLAILIWIERVDITNILQSYFSSWNNNYTFFTCLVLFILPLFLALVQFFKGYKIKLNKVNIKGAEANFNDDKNDDETVFDRDMKEIVYLLYNSEVDCIVFEDLDRYDNINIFTKLRELNFLLNCFLKANHKSYVVKFVYMLRDGIFESKNRTKFFDFILPVIPVVDSKTSENKLSELFEDIVERPDNDVLKKVALYIDDMRLLKNIVNEYLIYKNIIPMESIKLEYNKLFAIITLKNIFPKEFDLLQIDQGYIYGVFNRIENSRQTILNHYKDQIAELEKLIIKIKDTQAQNKFDAMALMIPSDILFSNDTSNSWNCILADWSRDISQVKTIFDKNHRYYTFNYEEFLNQFVLTTEEKKQYVNNFYDNRDERINIIKNEIDKIKQQSSKVEIYSYVDILNNLSFEEKDEIFIDTNYSIIHNHYFTLVRVLIMCGLVDETYWYYKGKLNFDKSHILGQNDQIYIKSLLEGKKIDVNLKVENPEEIVRHLSLKDFSRSNALNKFILEYMLKNKNYEYIITIVKSISIDYYDDLIMILDDSNLNHIDSLICILSKISSRYLLGILYACKDKSIELYKKILIRLILSKEIKDDYLNDFSKLIAEESSIISIVSDSDFTYLVQRMKTINIQLYNLSDSDISVDRLKILEKEKIFKINIDNSIYITEKLLDKHNLYGSLITDIFKSELLKVTAEYISDNFDSFINSYIDKAENDVLFSNDEDILIRIINSKIDDQNKLKYLNANTCVISNLKLIDHEKLSVDILESLLRTNMLGFTDKNLSYYWDYIEQYDNNLLEYIDRNINPENEEYVLKENIDICNILINDTDVTESLLKYLVKYADKPIEQIDSMFNESRLEILINHNLIAASYENFKVLIDNNYNSILINLIHNLNSTGLNDSLEILLKCSLNDDLIYQLINSGEVDKLNIRLLSALSVIPRIEYINPDNSDTIVYIINNYLSDINIKYICDNFGDFKYKNEFIAALNSQNKIIDIDSSYLHYEVTIAILKSDLVDLDIKTNLIIDKIISRDDISNIKNYIECVKEIAELAQVWEHKYPALDNCYKIEIGDTLSKNKYVKIRSDNKIMLSK